MNWELVFQEEDKPEVRKVVSADNIDPGSDRIPHEGRWWRHVADEATENPDVPIRVFLIPADDV